MRPDLPARRKEPSTTRLQVSSNHHLNEAEATMLPLLIALLLVSPPVMSSSGETFDESLDVRPLPDGKVAARFQFTSRSSGQGAFT